jgi:DNA primase
VGLFAGPGLLSGRIAIPIRNRRGEIVAYAGGALDGEVPKYKLPAGFRRGLELFNLHRAAAVGGKTVVLVEVLDGDTAGRAAAQAIVANLSRRCPVGVACLPDGAQPDQMSSSAIRALLENLK